MIKRKWPKRAKKLSREAGAEWEGGEDEERDAEEQRSDGVLDAQRALRRF